MPRKTRKPALSIVARTLASMRPRPDAAENTFASSRPGAAAGAGFNEAAARCRGKHEQALDAEQAVRVASMRPRPDAAENSLYAPAAAGASTLQ